MIRLGNRRTAPDVRQWLAIRRALGSKHARVETTNFTTKARGSTFQYGDEEHEAGERFTRVSDRTIDYQSPCPTRDVERARGPRSCRGTASTG